MSHGFIYHGIYIFVKNRNMKITAILVGLVLLASCTTQENYTLVKDESSLEWKGSITPDYFHTGNVEISSGTLMIENEAVKEGSFEINMGTISVLDEGLPNEKKSKLIEHLKNEDYFNTAGFPKVTVKVTGYQDGNLQTVLSVLGKELKRDIPVKMTKTESELKFNGNFDVDFDELKLPGMQPEEGSEDHVQSEVNYTLNLVLKKN
jgi:polyisoprenoid-binding protein YceI